MLRRIIVTNLFTTIFLIGCETKSTKSLSIDDSNLKSVSEAKKDSVEKVQLNESKATTINDNLQKAKIKDTLYYYYSQETNIPPDLYKNIFGHELSDTDKAYLKEIKTPLNSVVPVIVSFKTVESDTEKEYVDLHLFSPNWKLFKSLSLDYEMHWDLFKQEYQFVNDSLFEIYQYQGLSYDNDSTVKTTFIIKINKKNILDTIRIQIDTISHK